MAGALAPPERPVGKSFVYGIDLAAALGGEHYVAIDLFPLAGANVNELSPRGVVQKGSALSRAGGRCFLFVLNMLSPPFLLCNLVWFSRLFLLPSGVAARGCKETKMKVCCRGDGT